MEIHTVDQPDVSQTAAVQPKQPKPRGRHSVSLERLGLLRMNYGARTRPAVDDADVPLAAARGIVLGVLLAVVAWMLIGMAISMLL